MEGAIISVSSSLMGKKAQQDVSPPVHTTQYKQLQHSHMLKLISSKTPHCKSSVITPSASITAPDHSSLNTADLCIIYSSDSNAKHD